MACPRGGMVRARGSAAETQKRTDSSAPSAAGSRTSAPNSAGTEKGTGAVAASVSRIGPGLVGPRISTEVAPDHSGEGQPVPSP